MPATARTNALRQFLFADVAPLLDTRLDAAFELLELIRALPSPDPIALAMYGDCCMRAKRYGDAELQLEHALRLAPGLEPAQLMLAELYLLRDEITGARRIADAQQSCQDALRRRWIEAAAACDADRGWDQRIDHASTLYVQSEQALTAISAARVGALGACPAAVAQVVRARSDGFQRTPSLRVDLGARLSLPTVHDSVAALADSRAHFGHALGELEQDWTEGHLRGSDLSLQQLSWCNFLLAYQGEDDRNLQSRYGDWLAMAARTLRPDLTSSHGQQRRGMPRVGIVSGHWYACTAGWYFERWIDALVELPIELEVVALGPVDDAFSERLGQRLSGFLRVRGDADAIAQHLRQRQYDLLIYPEIGMYADLLPVAALRLAPNQWAAWGHPVTTGLPTIDRYISCSAMEPEDAASHYRESLLTLPGIGTHYQPPPAPPATTKQELGLPEAPTILVPQSTCKIHPDNDPIYREVLERDARLQLMFVVGGRASESARLRNRITRGLSTLVAKRVSFLPFLPRHALLRVMSAADLMLDTVHWSGGNTTLDALRAGLPVLTSRGRFMRGRQSAAMLDQMQVGSTLVTAPSDLARRAVDLLERDALSDTRRRIATAFDQVVDGREALATLRAAVSNLLLDRTEQRVLPNGVSDAS